MLTGRFIHIIDGYQQGSPQELVDPDLVDLTVDEVADLGWYQVLDVTIPTYNPVTERITEYNYSINTNDRTATPLYRVDEKYSLVGTSFEESCPICVDDYMSAKDKSQNPVLQALAKGKLTMVGTI